MLPPLASAPASRNPPPRDAFKHLGEEAGNLGCAEASSPCGLPRPRSDRRRHRRLMPDASHRPPPTAAAAPEGRGGALGGEGTLPPREAAAPKEERRFSPIPSFFRLWCLLLTAPTAAAAFGALRGPRRGGRGHLPLGQSSAPSEVLLSSVFGAFCFFIKL